MHKRRIWLLVVIGVALAIWLTIWVTHEGEPSYQGRPLGKWIVMYADNEPNELSDDRIAAEQAIRSIGTNGIPYLLKWMNYDQPDWRKKLDQTVQQKMPDNEALGDLASGASEIRAGAASIAFHVLGTNAEPAIPALETMMKDTTKRDKAARAILALGDVGERAFPALTNALANPQQLRRHAIILALDTIASHSDDGKRLCKPVFLQSLNDKDFYVRKYATNSLRSIDPQALTNAPSQ